MKYQYKVAKIATTTSVAQIETALNNNGTTGWELVSVFVVGTDYVFYLKRCIAN